MQNIIISKGMNMEKKILVAYATHAGSTREIAEFIGKVLTEKGMVAEVQEMKSVKSAKEYGGIVLGAPMYIFHILGDAHRFLKKYKKEIEKTPTAFFSLGPITEKEEDWKNAREPFEKELAKYPWFHPVGKEVFGGKLDSSKLAFPYSLMPGKDQLPQGDIRDWDKIKAWAESLAGKFNQ
jgi:menaquinone-dependent protoporphyrinogen oxidase